MQLSQAVKERVKDRWQMYCVSSDTNASDSSHIETLKALLSPDHMGEASGAEGVFASPTFWGGTAKVSLFLLHVLRC